MKVFRVAIATLLLGAVVGVGLIPSGYAQTVHDCNCLVLPLMRYGYKTPTGPCIVQDCYIG